MEVKKFNNESFGELTVFRNENTNVIMFVAKEVCEKWGHTNITQAIKNACLRDDEFKVIKLSKYPDFKYQLTKFDLVTSKAPTITMLSESGMYKLVLSSNFETAKPFKDSVTTEVLPSIRKNGYYSIADQSKEIMIHTNKSIQLNNSKSINSKNYLEKGVEGVIDYNRKNCIVHTGKTPHEMKEIGKNIGLKSNERSSAKEVLRHTKPELACSMSFVDSLVAQGFDFNTASELSLKAAVPLFQGMIELGIKPAELNK